MELLDKRYDGLLMVLNATPYASIRSDDCRLQLETIKKEKGLVAGVSLEY